MGRPPRFSREDLQRAALELVDAQGLEALSMRSLASALGTGPMTLYNHVRDRADLDVLVADAAMSGVRWSRTPPKDGREAVEEIATAMWRAVRVHPRAIPLILARRSRSRVVLDVAEALLEALALGGRRGKDLLLAFRAVTAYVVGAAQGELSSPLAVQAGEPPASTIARVLKLPAEQYPRLREIARVAVRSKAESEFRAGLRFLLDGLEARPPARRLARGSGSGDSRSTRSARKKKPSRPSRAKERS